MTIKEMQDRKRELGYTNELIAEKSGVPLGTVQKLFAGLTKAPRRKTVEALEKVLSDDSGKSAKDERNICGTCSRQPVRGVREPQIMYGEGTEQGKNTLKDYYALPDERRVELIDGLFYDMSAPSLLHQMILGELYALFRSCTDRSEGSCEGSCEVLLSPCDVRLDRDNRTMVQPDLFVLCRPVDITEMAVDGPPDLIVEVLSPLSRVNDMILKLYKYQRAGVREYWIVDPERELVLVYDLKNDPFSPAQYLFDSKIPIGISEGKCAIDFSVIAKKIRRQNRAGK